MLVLRISSINYVSFWGKESSHFSKPRHEIWAAPNNISFHEKPRGLVRPLLSSRPQKTTPDIGFGVASEMKSFARQIDGGVTKYGPQDPWMAYHLPAFSLCLWWLRKICHTWVLWVPRFLCLIHRLTVISFIMLIIHSMLGILPYKWMFNSEPLLSGLDCWTLSKSWNWCWPPTLSGNFLW